MQEEHLFKTVNGIRLKIFAGEGIITIFSPYSLRYKYQRSEDGILMGEKVTKLEKSVAPGFLVVFFTRKRSRVDSVGFCTFQDNKVPSLLG